MNAAAPAESTCSHSGAPGFGEMREITAMTSGARVRRLRSMSSLTCDGGSFSSASQAFAIDMVGGNPGELIRDGEPEFKSLRKKKADLSKADIAQAIARNPILLQRPIVVAGKKAAIGRPPEAVLPLLK